MHPFFERIEGVLKSLNALSPLTVVPYQLGHIKQAIILRSNVDRIKFIGFKDPNCANGRGEIEGRIDIYEMHEAPYAPPVTVASVYYLEDLPEPFKRFVVCKEMCQLLWLDAAMRVSTPETLIELGKLLVLPPITKQVISATGQFVSEKLAVMAALEILCPFEVRSALYPKVVAGKLQVSEIAEVFCIPGEQATLLFDQRYHEVIVEMRDGA